MDGGKPEVARCLNPYPLEVDHVLVDLALKFSMFISLQVLSMVRTHLIMVIIEATLLVEYYLSMASIIIVLAYSCFLQLKKASLRSAKSTMVALASPPSPTLANFKYQL